MNAYKREESQVFDADMAADLFDDSRSFGGCDLQLFRSGHHADVRIYCGNKMFPCHKSILSSRSSWFRNALLAMDEAAYPQPLAPGELPSFTCTSHSADDLEIVLIFIYAGKIEIDSGHGALFPCACIRTFALGNDFGVERMPDFSTEKMGGYLSSALQKLCDRRLEENILDNGHTEIQQWLRTSNFLAGFFEALCAADKIRSGGGPKIRLRPFQMLIDFFVAAKESLLPEPEFDLFLDDDIVPDFAKFVLLTERKGGCRTKWMRGLVEKAPSATKGRQGMCYDCGGSLKNLKENGGTGLQNPKSRKVIHTQACCVSCSLKEKNLDAEGNVKWDVFDAKKE